VKFTDYLINWQIKRLQRRCGLDPEPRAAKRTVADAKGGLGHGAEIGLGVGIGGVESFGRRDYGAGAGDGAEFSEEEGVHFRMRSG
jgi:hypothetical protein